MRDKIIDNLTARFAAYAELIEQADDAVLQEKLDVDKHKSLAEHFWCLIGARESYAKAITAGEWMGFACSLTSFAQADFREALATSAQQALSAIHAVDDWTDEREGLLATLAEHEVMHEGQIIRHIYGTGKSPPASLTWA